MSLIEWNDAFSVGIKKLDDHHKKFFSIINTLHDAMKNGEEEKILFMVLKELQQYVQYHFKAEETLMKMHAYPDYTSHIANRLRNSVPQWQVYPHAVRTLI